MCGIAGFVDKKKQLTPNKRKLYIQKMVESIEHRGRDDIDFYLDDSITLGHTRLSFFDTSSQGKQPMARLEAIVVFNGEIYNHQALRENLKCNYEFTTSTDTEVLIYALKKWHRQALRKLNGMWAFAYYSNNSLLLSIDRFGIKPLYYVNTPQFFAFASEVKALLQIPNIKAQLNPSALPEYLVFRNVSGNRTLFNHIKRLRPAEYLEYNIANNAVKTNQYWKPIKSHKPSHPQQTLPLIQQSLEEHLLADVPIGLQLSGGIDSSLLGVLAKTSNNPPRHSFSIGLKDKGWNEFSHSQQVAQLLNAEHHQLHFTESDFCQLLPQLTYHMDEPINHPHSIPMYILAKYARKYVKALISGEGADEIFGGYRRYKNLINNNALTTSDLVNISAFGDAAIMSSTTSQDIWRNPIEERLALINNRKVNHSQVDTIFILDLATYLPSLLLRQDKMGMAANVENRVPFLDHHLVEHTYSLDEKHKIICHNNRHLQTKPLLKQIALQYLPASTVVRPKVGFGLPISHWLKNRTGLGAYLNLFCHPLLRDRGLLDYTFIKQLVYEHTTSKQDHAESLWILINLEVWMRIFIDQQDPKSIWSGLKTAELAKPSLLNNRHGINS